MPVDQQIEQHDRHEERVGEPCESGRPADAQVGQRRRREILDGQMLGDEIADRLRAELDIGAEPRRQLWRKTGLHARHQGRQLVARLDEFLLKHRDDDQDQERHECEQQHQHQERCQPARHAMLRHPVDAGIEDIAEDGRQQEGRQGRSQQPEQHPHGADDGKPGQGLALQQGDRAVRLGHARNAVRAIQ